jgi:hypothetical protein
VTNTLALRTYSMLVLLEKTTRLPKNLITQEVYCFYSKIEGRGMRHFIEQLRPTERRQVALSDVASRYPHSHSGALPQPGPL